MAGEGDGRGVLYSKTRYEYVEPDDQVSTASYAALTGSVIDTALKGLGSVCYSLKETVGANGVTFVVQGALVNSDSEFVDLKTHDELGAERGSVNIPVAAGQTAYAIIPASGDVGAKGAFRYYRVREKDTSSPNHGTARVRGFAK